MATYVCEKCGFKSLVRPETYCVNCGYNLDFWKNYRQFSPAQLRQMKDRQIAIRHAVCSIPEKDTTKKGLHAYCAITNQGIRLEIFEKFDYGIFTKKKWTFRQNPVIQIPFEDIVAIERATYQGKPARYFNYITKTNGVVPLGFYAEGGIASNDLDAEMKKLVEKFMA